MNTDPLRVQGFCGPDAKALPVFFRVPKPFRNERIPAPCTFIHSFAKDVHD